MAAAENGDIETVKTLLNDGVEADSEVLFWAAAYEHKDVCDLLINHGVEVTEEIERMIG